MELSIPKRDAFNYIRMYIYTHKYRYMYIHNIMDKILGDDKNLLMQYTGRSANLTRLKKCGQNLTVGNDLIGGLACMRNSKDLIKKNCN